MAEQPAKKRRKAPTKFYAVWTAPPDPELLHESLVITLAELLQKQAADQVKQPD